MKRFQIKKIVEDLKKKMVFIVGPRQIGKTWLSKEIERHFDSSLYLNYDNFDDKAIIESQLWDSHYELLIFDEIHKMSQWKTYIKGVFDKKQAHQKILVTGSARLDVFRKMGDALTGRFFKHRLLPYSVKELDLIQGKKTIADLFDRGGFPEPLLAPKNEDAQRWRQDYLDSLLREDILEFQNISQLNTMNTLVKLLQKRVASPLSYASLSRDLNTSIVTVKKYIEVLEALFIIFRVTPYSRNIARSILKEPKLYFYDWAMVEGDVSLKYENFMATSLLKHCYALRDYKGKDIKLHYLRTKEHKEVDFCLVDNGQLSSLIECKYSNISLSPTLNYFSEKYNLSATQVIYDMGNKAERQINGIRLISAKRFLKNLFL